MTPIEQTLVHKVLDALADGHAAGAEAGCKGALRGDLLTALQPPGGDLGTQGFPYLDIDWNALCANRLGHAAADDE